MTTPSLSKKNRVWFLILSLFGIGYSMSLLTAETVVIEGVCRRVLVNTNLLPHFNGATLSPDALESLVKFRLELEKCSWILSSRHSANRFQTEETFFSDGVDCFTLMTVSTNQAASITKGPIPAGGTGNLQTIWMALCRPMCKRLDWQSFRELPDLVALQELNQRQYSQVIATTNSLGRLTQLELFRSVRTNLVLVERFEFSDSQAKMGIFSDLITRKSFAVDPIKATNVVAYRYEVEVSNIVTNSSPLALPELTSIARIVDFRLNRRGSERWYVEYASKKWRSEVDLRADPEIALKIDAMEKDQVSYDQVIEGRTRRQRFGRWFFIGVLIVLPVAIYKVRNTQKNQSNT